MNRAGIGRAVLTIATGKPVYIRMAVALARSFKHWHKDGRIGFALATDRKDLLPPDLRDIEVIELEPGQYGDGFSPKLHLDRLAPAEQTLFIDSDCLCVGSLETVFDRFAGRAVSVVGGMISEGEWFGDVAAICRRFNVPSLPKFNGGIYYLEKSAKASRVYQTARELEPRYDEIGLVRLRGKPNDELLMAIAMALHNQSAVPDDGTILGDPQACPGGLSVDVLGGKSWLRNPPSPDPQHRPWYPLTEINPVVVHFLGDYTTAYPYTREELKMALIAEQGYPTWAASLRAMATRSVPQLSSRALKNILRPVYHRLFGVRPVSASDRI